MTEYTLDSNHLETSRPNRASALSWDLWLCVEGFETMHLVSRTDDESHKRFPAGLNQQPNRLRTVASSGSAIFSCISLSIKFSSSRITRKEPSCC